MGNTMTHIVLGIDALDIELIEAYGLSESFGSVQTKNETHSNPVIDEPHTKELWPSIISGLHPDEHGIHAVTESSGVQWDNPLLDTASSLANGIVPKSVLTEIGRILRSNGVGVSEKPREYYKQNDISTIFEQLNGMSISIPNYQTEYDRQHDLDASRNDFLGAITADKTHPDGVAPQVSLPGVYAELDKEVGKRLGHLKHGLAAGQPFVFVWFGVIDSVGHIQPAIDAPIQEQYYRYIAAVVEYIRGLEGVQVITISDHGLQNGEHTKYATICADDERITEIESVFDVADYLLSVVETGAEGSVSVDGEELDSVTENLERLGYL